MVRVLLNVNRASLTIKQVLTKHHKMLGDMVWNLKPERLRSLWGSP